MATDLERLTVQVDASLVKFERALAKMEGRSAASAKKVERTFAAMQGRLNGIFAGLGGGAAGALGVLGVGLGAQQVLQYADAWTKANNSLKVAGLSGAELNSTLDALYAAAQRQGAPLEALTVLFSRTSQAQKELGASTQELLQFSEDVATALRVAGTSPQDATGALLQLSQALGSARVQAEEFNSINEGARPILQAVANGIEEAGGSVSKLKQLVNDGEISNVAFFKGFQAGVESIRDQAAEAEPTIGQAFTRIQNAVIKLIGEVDKSTGFTSAFVDELTNMGKKIEELAAPILKIIDLLQKLNDLYAYVSNNGLNLGSKLNQAIFGADTVEEFLVPTESRGVGPTTRNTGRSRSAATAPISAADYPVVGAKEKGASKQRADDYARETAQIRERTAALELEARTIGMSTFEVERAKIAFDLMNAAKAAGKEITPELTAQINAEADAYARAAVEVEKAREAQQQMEEVQRGLQSAFSGLVSDLAKGEDAIDSLTAALSRLADQLLDMVTQQLFKQLLAGIPGLSFSSGTVGGTTGATFGNVGFASGGQISGPGTGTSDSILARLSNGEFVVNAAMAKRFGPLLEAINSGRFRLPAFATGGAVGGPAPRAVGMGGVNVQVVNNTGTAATGRVETQRGPNGQLTVKVLLDAMRQELVSDLERMGPIAKAHQSRFGLSPERGMMR